jgi:iron complex transport system ATP-binding protein
MSAERLRALLDVRALEFAYSADHGASGGRFGLGPLTFDLYQKEFLAIIGPNGSGKSTLLRLLAGLLKPARGCVNFAGREVSEMPARERARQVAVVRQDAALVFPMTVEQFLLLGRYAYVEPFAFESEKDRQVARTVMELTQTCSLAGRRMDEISGGERQRVVLARALAQQPQLLLLDEPTANLDLSFQLGLLRLIRRLASEQAMGVAAVMHEVNLASEFADYILLLRGGRLFRFGTPEEVLTAKVLEEVYGVPVRVDWNPASGRPHVTVMATASL